MQFYLDTYEAERVLVRLWGEMPARRKMELVGEMTATVKMLSRAGLAQRFPNAPEAELERRLADLFWGQSLPNASMVCPRTQNPSYEQ